MPRTNATPAPTSTSAPSQPRTLTLRSPVALSSYPPTPNTREQCAEARFHAKQCCPVTAAAGVVTAEPSSVAERRRRGNSSEVCAVQPAVAVVVAVEDVRTPATPFVARSAFSVRRAGVRPTGRADVRCPGDRCPRPLHSGCPDGHASGVCGLCVRAVRTALDPGRRCRGAALVWAPRVRRVAVVRERRGRRRPNRASREGMVVCRQCMAGMSIDGRPGPPLRTHRGCGAALAAWPTKGAGPAPGCRSVGLEAREGAEVLTSPPQVPPGQVAGVMLDHGAGPGGGDHAPWSLSWCWSRVVRRWRARPVQRGADCGRSAAAVWRRAVC
jgi:hypothetical protein